MGFRRAFIFGAVLASVLALLSCSNDTLSLTTVASPAQGGRISHTPIGNQFDRDTVVSLQTIPEPGYRFSKWDGCPVAAQGKDQTPVIRMVSDTTCTAVFDKIQPPKIDPAPLADPNQVAPGERVKLTVQAKSNGDPPDNVEYTWAAMGCTGLPRPGDLENPSAKATIWVAPPNNTRAFSECKLQVTVSDRYGQNNADVTVKVNPVHIPPILSITSDKPLAESDGAINLSASARDTLENRRLQYDWEAKCPAPLTSGSFSDPKGAQTRWAVPRNATGNTVECTFVVTVQEGEEYPDRKSVSGTQTQKVLPLHEIVIRDVVPEPGGPVESGKTLKLLVTAMDSLQHDLNFEWGAVCPGLGGTGRFGSSEGGAVTWQGPQNNTGVSQQCEIKVTAKDRSGLSNSSKYNQVVLPPHEIRITADPLGVPNPVASRGRAQLSASAIDTHEHPLTFSWAASCPLLSANGSFKDVVARNTEWTAPPNPTGQAQDCTVTLTVNDQVKPVVVSFHQGVSPEAPHEIVFKGGVVPDQSGPVEGGKALSLQVTAVDSLKHDLRFTWEAVCSGLQGSGRFPKVDKGTAIWEAPQNNTGASQQCEIRVTADDQLGLSDSSKYNQVVLPPHELKVTGGPSGLPNPVASRGTVQVNASALDTHGHSLTYLWEAACPSLSASGSFKDLTTRNTEWTAPANQTGVPQACTITFTVDDHVKAVVVSFQQSVSRETLEIRVTGTPNPVLPGGAVAVTLGGITPAVGSPEYVWKASCEGLQSRGDFQPSKGVAVTWTAPPNPTGTRQRCEISVLAGSTPVDSYVQSVDPSPTIRITALKGSPNPAPSASQVELEASVTDDLGRELHSNWSAICPGLAPLTGTFSDTSILNPIWFSPPNGTAKDQDCEITLTVPDGSPRVTRSLTIKLLGSIPTLIHELKITQGPSSDRSPAPSQGRVQMSVRAVDTSNHALTYSWESLCHGGILPRGNFVAPATANPAWTAPANSTANQIICVIRVTISDQDKRLTAIGTFEQLVDPAPHTLTITSGPSGTVGASGTAGSVVSSGRVGLTVTAFDSKGHELTYKWVPSCPALRENGDMAKDTAASTTWTAPPNTTGREVECTMTVTVTDTASSLQTVGSYTQVVLPQKPSS